MKSVPPCHAGRGAALFWETMNMSRMKRVAIAAAAISAFLLLLALALPPVLRQQAQKWVAAETGRTLAVKDVSFNPLNLTFEVRGLSLSERGEGAPFVSFDRLRLNLSSRSLFERAFIANELRLEGVRVHVVRTAPNRFNFSDLLDRSEPAGKPAPSEPARFLLNNLVVTGGAVDFDDRGVSPAGTHTVRDLELSVPFIGNVPSLVDSYVTPLLSATVNGAPFRLEGKLKPFADTVEVSTGVRFERLDLPTYLSYFPKELPVRIGSGRLGVDLKLAYRASRTEKPELTAGGTVSLDALDLRERGGEPLLRLPHLQLDLRPSSLLEKEIDLARVTVRDPEVTLIRSREGKWNLAELASGEKDEETPSPRIALGTLRLRGGKIHFRDELPKGGFKTELKEIAVDLDRFGTAPGHRSSFAFGMQSEAGERLTGRGDFSLEPLTAALTLDAGGIPLAPYRPYLDPFLAHPLDGTLAARGKIELAEEGAVRIADGAVEAQELSAPFGGRDGALLKRVALGGIAVDTGARRAEVATASVEGGKVRFSRGADGAWSPLALLRPSPGETKKEDGKPFSWHLGRVSVAGLQTTFVDGGRPERPEFTLRDLRLDLTGVNPPGPAFSSLLLSAGLGRQGNVTLTGKGRGAPLGFSGELRMKRFPLIPFTPYLPDDLRFELVDGAVDARLALDLRQKGEKVGGTVTGDVGVRRFEIVDDENADDLLRWESLQIGGLRTTLDPFSLRISAVALNDFLARIIVLPDGSLNLQRAFGKKEAPTAPAEAPQVIPVAAAAAPRPSIAIDAVTLQNGTVDFTDRHMSPAFRTTMVKLGGRVVSLASDGARPAEVDLRGTLENHSPLTISGSLDPLGKNLFADLKIRFSDIELSPTTPYSARYLGYLVEKGKLFLDLDYHIENGALKSRNRIFLDQFTFGEKVESDDATSLPVRLAVNLLKDRRGEIHLDLPVQGTLNDPEFSVWGVVWKMLKNLVVRAATSPVALLTSLAAGGEEFSAVSFPAGSTVLTEAEAGRLRQLAEALKERPAVKLEVMGFADREHDPEGVRREVLQGRMRREKYLELAKSGDLPPGATAEQMEVPPAEVPRYLEAVYRKASFPKPRNVVGMVKSLPEEEMRKLILANTPAGEEELQSLAWGRGAAVRNFLMKEGELPPERIFQKKGDIFRPAEKGVAARVEFGISSP